jgi:hypothetical protein
MCIHGPKKEEKAYITVCNNTSTMLEQVMYAQKVKEISMDLA